MFKFKKGQVTIFAVLGIVILVVIVFALVVSSSLSKMKLQAQASKVVDAYLESEAINYYVYTCMDAAVTTAIDDVALQGGVFYDYQQGNAIASKIGRDYIPYELEFTNYNGEKRKINFNVSYSIMDHKYLNCDIVEQDIPGYPISREYVSSFYGIYNDKSTNNCLYNQKEGYALSGFAGFNNMTRLCYIEGMGSPNIKALKREEASSERDTPLGLPNHCANNYILDKNMSIEYTLQEQISKRVQECVNFSLFVDDNISVTGSPQTTVIYNSESIRVETFYNFSVKIKNKDPVFVKHKFTYESDLRIVRMHNYVMTLIKADVQDFFFRMPDNYKIYTQHALLNPKKFFDEEAMSVKIINFTKCDQIIDVTIEGCEDIKYDHILIVEDNKSRIGNRSLTYVTAIKNRKPALDFIHTTTLLDGNFDIVVSNNANITISPFGYDPDDRNVTYAYDGWKETYNEICTLNLQDITVSCQKIDDEPLPHNWTQSYMFKDTKRAANYTTNETDVGPHNLTVTVTDESGLQDYQLVKILVFDLPKAIITLDKYYEDIDANMVSIEDPFILDGRESHGSQYPMQGGLIEEYIWTIYHMQNGEWIEVFTNKTTENTSFVPTEFKTTILDKNQQIQLKKPRAIPDNFETLNLSNTSEHNITLVVKSRVPLVGELVSSIPDTAAVESFACLPHRNENNPYPYNIVGTDPFQANHTCCNDNYEITQGNTCFKASDYGRFEDLKIKAQTNEDWKKENALAQYYNGLPNPLVSAPANPYPNGGDYNDVYRVEFTRACDGYRGNICAGAMSASFIVADTCGNKIGNEEETCRGPNSATNAQEECINYPAGETFETTFGLSTPSGVADGVCNENPVCSTIGLNGYGVMGPQLCTAICSSGGCTNAQDANCECKVGASPGCNAECDATHSFLREGFVCKSGCELENRCTFQTTENLPCGGTSTSCLSTQAGFANYCYTGVICNVNGGDYVKGEYCKVGLEPLPSGNPNICRYWNSINPMPTTCSAGGICPLPKQDKSQINLNCGTNIQPICSPTQGWICP